MKLCDLIKELSEFDGQRDVVFFSNGYKEIKIIDSEDGVIIVGKGKICPSVKTAIKNEGKEASLYNLCSWNNKENNSELDPGE